MERSSRERRNALVRTRKERMERRKQALQNAIEGLFVARGWSIKDAAEFAFWWVCDRLGMAKLVMERYGYDYLNMTWRMA